jgi:histidyl-tRNA synthetase
VLVTVFDAARIGDSLRVSDNLRRAGLNTELYFENDPLGAQIRHALKRSIPYVIIVGPDEASAGQVTIRYLPLKEQRTVEAAAMIDHLKDWGGMSGT